MEKFTPNQLKKTAERVKSDANLINKGAAADEGAEYVQDEGADKPRLEISKSALEDMVEFEKIKELLVDLEKRLKDGDLSKEYSELTGDDFLTTASLLAHEIARKAKYEKELEFNAYEKTPINDDQVSGFNMSATSGRDHIFEYFGFRVYDKNHKEMDFSSLSPERRKTILMALVKRWFQDPL